MERDCQEIIWNQFGAAIDSLENAIKFCTDEVWFDNEAHPPFWALVHHTLFWLDYYLTDPGEEFSPPAPIGLEELDPDGILPERPLSREELLGYLAYGREKCRTTIADLTDEKGSAIKKFRTADLTFAELLLYNLRHVQHGAAQLNLILRQRIDDAPGWIFRSRIDLDGN